MPEPIAGTNKSGTQKYSDPFKISALTQYDLTGQLRPTAKAFGIPSSTLKNWITERAKGEMTIEYAPEMVAQIKKKLISRSVTIMDKALNRIDETIDKCSAPQAATVYGILHDKVAMMEGTATPTGGNLTINNTYINQLPDAEAERLMKKAIGRMQGKVIEASYTVEDDQSDSIDSSGDPAK